MFAKAKTFIATCLITSAFAGAAHAVTIAPLPRIDLDRDGSANVWVTEDDHYWRARVYSVDQATGEEVLRETEEVEVDPELFKAPATIKVSTTLPPTGNQEKYYRLVLTMQVTKEELAFAKGVMVAPKMIIPLVWAPDKPAESFVCLPNGEIKNTGNVHIKLKINGEAKAYWTARKAGLFPRGWEQYQGYQVELKNILNEIKGKHEAERISGYKKIEDLILRYGISDEQYWQLNADVKSHGGAFYILPGMTRAAGGFEREEGPAICPGPEGVVNGN